MAFDRRLGSRDNYVIATLGNNVEDEFGNINQTPNSSNTIEFWAMVRDEKSNRSVDDGKRRNVVTKSLHCDSRDVENLTIEHRITIDDRGITYIPVDIFESDFKYETTIIIKEIS